MLSLQEGYSHAKGFAGLPSPINVIRDGGRQFRPHLQRKSLAPRGKQLLGCTLGFADFFGDIDIRTPGQRKATQISWGWQQLPYSVVCFVRISRDSSR